MQPGGLVAAGAGPAGYQQRGALHRVGQGGGRIHELVEPVAGARTGAVIAGCGVIAPGEQRVAGDAVPAPDGGVAEERGDVVDLVLDSAGDQGPAGEDAGLAGKPLQVFLDHGAGDVRSGLLHCLGRLPFNLVGEMFFTAAPLDAQEAREWLVVNHLVGSAELEGFALELAATIAAKSPMAMAVIKEQLRVLTDYQPVAAHVYERVEGLRREAYESSDYLEGLRAFAEKRPPVFRGT